MLSVLLILMFGPRMQVEAKWFRAKLADERSLKTLLQVRMF